MYMVYGLSCTCISFQTKRKILTHCLGVRHPTPRLWGYGSGTGPQDTDSRVPVPDPEPGLLGISRGCGSL